MGGFFFFLQLFAYHRCLCAAPARPLMWPLKVPEDAFVSPPQPLHLSQLCPGLSRIQLDWPLGTFQDRRREGGGTVGGRKEGKKESGCRSGVNKSRLNFLPRGCNEELNWLFKGNRQAHAHTHRHKHYDMYREGATHVDTYTLNSTCKGKGSRLCIPAAHFL